MYIFNEFTNDYICVSTVLFTLISNRRFFYFDFCKDIKGSEEELNLEVRSSLYFFFLYLYTRGSLFLLIPPITTESPVQLLQPGYQALGKYRDSNKWEYLCIQRCSLSKSSAVSSLGQAVM